MNKSAAKIARKRARAREQGVCITCFMRPTETGRSVCRPCNVAAARRTARRRIEQRKLARLAELSSAYERAGDEAHKHDLYPEAVAHYRAALGSGFTEENDKLRILEKLAYSVALAREPTQANGLVEKILEARSLNPADRANAVEILLQSARQIFIDTGVEKKARSQNAAESKDAVEMLLEGARQKRTYEGAGPALPFAARALKIAEASGDLRLRRLAHRSMVNLLFALQRLDQSEKHIRAMGKVGERDDPSTRAAHHYYWGVLAAFRGNALEAFDHLESAVAFAKDDPDVDQVVRMWNVYGNHAARLGNLELARSCYERALFVARQCQVSWLIANINLEYAEILKLSGAYELAHERLREALSYNVRVPIVDANIAEVGIPLCLSMNDNHTLAECVRPSAIDYVFSSGELSKIGSVSAAFADWYAIQGRVEEAQHLLRRGIRSMKYAWTWDFPIAVARFGSDEDIPKGRALLAQFAALPSSSVAQACLDLFDAFAAERRGRGADKQTHARQAAKKLDMLGYFWYADLARSLYPSSMEGRGVAVPRRDAQRGMLPTLTAREQQVAALVLKGLTNREIAEQLSISKYTVDSHVTSIIGRLGIRSRHQIAEALPIPN